MRILVVVPFYKPAHVYGGPTRSIPTLCQALESLGVEVVVYTTNANGNTHLEIEPNCPVAVDGVSVTYYERDVRNSYFYSRKLAQGCYHDTPNFDCVFVSSNWGYPFIPACRAALKHDVPYVITARNSFNKKTWAGKYLKKMLYHRLVERRLINQANLLHFTTEWELEESRWLGLEPRYCVVPNPVDLTEFNQVPTRGLWRKTQNISAETLIVFYLGRIDSGKGLNLTVEAFAKVLEINRNVLLVIAGPEEDGYVATLQALGKRLGITERLRFTGYLNAETRLQALVDADVFILTSYAENFGMAVVEAMAIGLPVLLSDRVGIARDVKNAGAGLVTPLDVDAIASALKRLLASEPERNTLGQRAMLAARERYSPMRIAQLMLEHFRQVVQ